MDCSGKEETNVLSQTKGQPREAVITTGWTGKRKRDASACQPRANEMESAQGGWASVSKAE